MSVWVACCVALAAGTGVFPGAEWERRAPADAGVDANALRNLSDVLGGRGCVIKDGYIVHEWGDQAERGDWASSAKPVLSTLLFFAIEESRAKGVDQPIVEFGWPLTGKDRGITFRHLGAMSSGYARPEGPGEAWAYNDFAIQLYQKTLFDYVFKGDPKTVAEAPERLGALGFQDGLEFSQDKRRIKASVRDFARIAWFWMNRGRWGDKQVLPAAYFDDYMRPQTPKDLRQTRKAKTDDYLGIGSYGGDSDHFTDAGPGVYGFNWWFNDTGRQNPNIRMWPDAPPDTFMSVGAGGNCAAMMPSLGLVVVSAKGRWGELRAGDAASKFNTILKIAAEAGGYQRTAVAVSGGMRQWQPITLDFSGPRTGESADPNPFTDYRLTVTFACEDTRYAVPGYFAADGNAAESGATDGNVWRAHFVPDRPGTWTYFASFREGKGIATNDDMDAGMRDSFDGATGQFEVQPSDAAAPGFHSKGTLRYAGKHYLQFAGTGEYFIKGGADSPENLLAFADFDGTKPSHRYGPHAQDWRPGDPVWRGDKGKNLIGALNYLASKGMNSVYFLPMNVRGDGKDVWPWTDDAERFRFDCSKLDQWEIVFSHMDRLGLALHVVLQEQENDQLLDGGELGPERRLFARELIARFSHHLGLVWNLGEENTNTDAQRKAFADYLRLVDPYNHPIVLHTFPNRYDEAYSPLLGFPSLEGPSLQLGNMETTYAETLKWVKRSAAAGRPWFVCQDEIGPANTGVKPDADDPEHNEVRRHALWGNLMAGGAGVEWLFGYNYAHNDINCEDWRSRDRMWDQTRYALEFFQKHLPFIEMAAVSDVVQDEGAWCFAKPGHVYAIYTPMAADLSVTLPRGRYTVGWYDPRNGGELQAVRRLKAEGATSLGEPPSAPDRDWVLLVKRRK